MYFNSIIQAEWGLIITSRDVGENFQQDLTTAVKIIYLKSIVYYYEIESLKCFYWFSILFYYPVPYVLFNSTDYWKTFMQSKTLFYRHKVLNILFLRMHNFKIKILLKIVCVRWGVDLLFKSKCTVILIIITLKKII